MDEHRIPVAGDPFHAAGEYRRYLDWLRAAEAGRRDGCPACFGGYVTITVEEDGEEHAEAVSCRRCDG